MAKNIYADFKKKLDRIENHIAEEVAPQANELLKESVRYSLIDWYNDYTPQSYERTYNFMKILDSTKTRGKGNVLCFSVDSGAMDSYVGWSGHGWGNTYDEPREDGKYSNKKGNHQKLNASLAFDYMFMNGEHGHGKWMMHQSLPPYMYVERDIESGFGGRLDKIINNRIDQILRK